MLVGIIIGILVCIVGIETYTILKPENKDNNQKVKLSKEEKEKQKKIQKAFNNLMSYDYTIASKRRDS